MIKSKLATTVAVATLAIAPCLSACAGQDGTVDTSAGNATEPAGSADSTDDAEGADVVTAEGTTDDGRYKVIYLEDQSSESEDATNAILILSDVKTDEIIDAAGPVSTDEDGKSTIVDTSSENSISYEIGDADGTTGEIRMTIDKKGGATLTMTDKETVLADIEATVARRDTSSQTDGADAAE